MSYDCIGRKYKKLEICRECKIQQSCAREHKRYRMEIINGVEEDE